MNKLNLTVVYEFSDQEAFKAKADEVRNLFPGQESDPVRITAMSNKDEITKLDLMEFGHEIGDLDFIGRVIRADNIPELLDQMKRSHKYAEEHSVTAAYGYEMAVLEA